MDLKLQFGFASRKPVKEKEVPKFDFCYVEMCPSSELKGGVSKFRLLNGAADQLMGFVSTSEVNRIAYAQDAKEPNLFFLVNVTDFPGRVPSEHKLNKDFSFNSSALNERICKQLELDSKKAQYFEAIPFTTVVGDAKNPLNVLGLHLITDDKENTKDVVVDVEEVKVPVI